MKQNRKIHSALLLVALLLVPIAGCANFKDNAGHHQGPPPEAIKACEGQSDGDLITFTGPRGESIKATCQDMHGQLIAVPEDRPKGKHHQGPPPEAIKACKGQHVGNIVKFVGVKGESITARCQDIQGLLVAVPEGKHINN